MAHNVFICWAGNTSRLVAESLHDWLQAVLQNVDPFFSPETIERGQSWLEKLGATLSGVSVGIVCLTRDNLAEPWIHFEVGALWKGSPAARIVPFLFDIDRPADVKHPLAAFQMVRARDKKEIRQLLGMLNVAVSQARPLAEGRLDQALEAWWPDLEKRLDVIARGVPVPAAPPREVREMVAELLELVRQSQRTPPTPEKAVGSGVGAQEKAKSSGVPERDTDKVAPAEKTPERMKDQDDGSLGEKQHGGDNFASPPKQS